MCRTNGLKKIYESELNRKSEYYAVFDALLPQLCALSKLYARKQGFVSEAENLYQGADVIEKRK